MNSKKDICFFGKEKVGKTSIIKMIFNKTHPQDTSYLESTRELEVSEVEFKGFYKFNIMDFPGHYEASDIKPSEEEILQECGAVIYVADSKDEDIGKTAKQLKDFCRLMMKLNPNVSMNIFFHQSDVDIYNGEKTTDGIQILMEAVESIRDPAMGPNKNSNSNNQTAGFFFTSIYDASINESMSKVISKLVAERLPHLGNMMNDLYSNCNLDKVYLFDMVTKIFFCTDYVPLNMDNFSLCADMLDVYMDFSCIYGDKPEEPHDEGKNGEDSNWEPYEQVIRMTDKKILFLQQIQGHVTLVCNFNEDYMDRKGVIEYNIKVFRQTWDKMITKQSADTKGKTASKF